MNTHLTAEDVKIAVNELNEPSKHGERIQEIYKIRNLYKTQGCGIKLIDDSDEFLLRFLRARRFYQNEALKLLNNYHLYMNNWPELKEKIENPHLVKHVFEAGCFIALESRAIDGSVVCIGRPGKLDNFVFSDYVAAVILSINVLLKEETNQIHGITFLIDRKYLTLSFMQLMRPYFVKKFIDLYQKVLPIRIRSINLLNESAFFHVLYAMSNLFISDSSRQMLVFHGINLNSLHKYVKGDDLPPCYGGTGPNIDNIAKSWKNTVYDYYND